MSHSTVYRICLLVVVVLTIIGGIFYYVNYMERHRHTKVTEGTLVMEEGHNGEKEAMCGAQNLRKARAWYGWKHRNGISKN